MPSTDENEDERVYSSQRMTKTVSHSTQRRLSRKRLRGLNRKLRKEEEVREQQIVAAWTREDSREEVDTPIGGPSNEVEIGTCAVADDMLPLGIIVSL
jgi:hypothetical protein